MTIDTSHIIDAAPPLRYHCATPPEHGRVEELHPGIFWARMQLPFRPWHVNIWLLASDDGWTIVDTGADTPRAHADMSAILTHLGCPTVRQILVTHAHVDHGGMAGRLCTEHGASLLMPRTEWLHARLLQLKSETATYQVFYHAAGCPADWSSQVAVHRDWMAQNLSMLPRRFYRIRNGDALRIGGREWGVMTGGGHAYEQAALHGFEDGILIAADHLLPRIRPAVGARVEEPNSDPLQDAFDSLAMLSGIPADTLILPSHGEPFYGISSAIYNVNCHHRKRLRVLNDALGDEGLSAYEALPLLFPREMTFEAMRIPVGEIFALLRHLEIRGFAHSYMDDAGVRRFTRA